MAGRGAGRTPRRAATDGRVATLPRRPAAPRPTPRHSRRHGYARAHSTRAREKNTFLFSPTPNLARFQNLFDSSCIIFILLLIYLLQTISIRPRLTIDDLHFHNNDELDNNNNPTYQN